MEVYVLSYSFLWFNQMNYSCDDIKGINKTQALLHRLAETEPVNLCNNGMEILVIS